MCKKQTSVSHSSTESDIISLDSKTPTKPVSGKRYETGECSRNTSKTKPKGHRDVQKLSPLNHVPASGHSSQDESQLYIFDDDKAVIKMTIKGRSPKMRHVSRTHRVAVDWLFERINMDPTI